MKFAHIADTHIKNLKYHYEYRKIFQELYESLQEENIDCIIHCGDIAHTKTQISPEFVELCSDFFTNLASIAPTYIILGNHDGNLRNSNRQDAITPIVQALNLPNIHLLKNSGEAHLDDKFCLNVLSVFDEENWIDPTDTNKVNIALYHGSISNCRTDKGWVMEHGEHELEIFDNFDYAMLGDIHKKQSLDYKQRIQYAGSTIQQNHGEEDNKGYLIWDIADKDVFNVKHVEIKNPKPFITIELTPKGRMPKSIDVPIGARLRLVSNNNLPLDKMKHAVDVAKHRFKPESITFLNRALGTRNGLDAQNNNFIKENLRDVTVQKKLIRQFLKDYEVDDEIMERIFDLNTKYNQTIEATEEVARNINWQLESFQWDNLFNYDEGNELDIKKLNGIVGIFGKNYSGKSSIVDGMLYTIFNSTSKNERKNLNIINQNKDLGVGTVKIRVGDKLYTIERTSEKYTKKLKGEETLEAKTVVDFNYCSDFDNEVISCNGLSRNDTDKNIRKMFGTIEDFLLTSMASQLDSLSFIKEGSTKRKEILAKFLDLELFDKKFKMAKEDAADLRGALKRLEGREFDADIDTAQNTLEDSNEQITQHKQQCKKYNDTITKLTQQLSKINETIGATPVEIIDIHGSKNDLTQKQSELKSAIETLITLQQQKQEKEELEIKINKFVEQFDVVDLENKKQLMTDTQKDLEEILDDLSKKNDKVEIFRRRVRLLSEVPCGDKFPNCKFICDAHKAQEELPGAIDNIKDLRTNSIALIEDIDNLGAENIEDHLDKHNQLLGKLKDTQNEISIFSLEITNNNTRQEMLVKEVEELQNKILEYEKNQEIIDNTQNLINKKNTIANKIESTKSNLVDCEEELQLLYVTHGSCEQKLTNLREQKEELNNLREEYAAYDLFMQCMHTGGISYDIIKNKLPIINEEIAKVLANIVDFEVFFEDDGRRLNIFIKHPKHDPRPIEMGSGAEKTIAAMAIRLSLLSVSNLPKSNIFILDEPGTSLDAENLEGFIRILDMVKSYFRVVIMISHLDSLKDCVDTVINIDKHNDYACVNQ